MNNNCGLVSEKAFCKCRKRLLIAHDRGRLSTGAAERPATDIPIGRYLGEMQAIDSVVAVFRENPFSDKTARFKKEMEAAFSVLKDIY